MCHTLNFHIRISIKKLNHLIVTNCTFFSQNQELLPQPKSLHGDFYTERSYIILIVSGVVNCYDCILLVNNYEHFDMKLLIKN